MLSILFTDPEYQRLGAGSMMVKWGCDLADHLFLPVWVEGSEKGHELYLQNGFEDVENVNTQTKKWVSHYYMMRRPRKVSMVEGKSLSIIP